MQEEYREVIHESYGSLINLEKALKETQQKGFGEEWDKHNLEESIDSIVELFGKGETSRMRDNLIMYTEDFKKVGLTPKAPQLLNKLEKEIIEFGRSYQITRNKFKKIIPKSEEVNRYISEFCHYSANQIPESDLSILKSRKGVISVFLWILDDQEIKEDNKEVYLENLKEEFLLLKRRMENTYKKLQNVKKIYEIFMDEKLTLNKITNQCHNLSKSSQ